MKSQINFSNLVIVIAMIGAILSCSQNSVDPALVLDEVLIPDGYHQVDAPPADALARLEELRLENSQDHFYYLKRNDLNNESWIFPQKKLKIEYVANSISNDHNQKSEVLGLVVKKIKGNYLNEKFTIVENQPAPKDGLGTFYQYISSNLKYPEAAKKVGIQGKVYIEFVVDKNGNLTEIQVMRGIGSGCDEEAVRVLKEAPQWNPGLVTGTAAKVKMILPISYKLG